ncbi:hypothetical protein JTE90_007301 [Oedothorax gibbosus]|uniref:Uncharacterized protein n=1 Tax=Oedothorax gibbosus TaxID=931172 RepID=A0AAV6UEZ0_9ARAC|nr:hypothetical protein JTE90_007301 [Oedothorax gibbosus]
MCKKDFKKSEDSNLSKSKKTANKKLDISESSNIFLQVYISTGRAEQSVLFLAILDIFPDPPSPSPGLFVLSDWTTGDRKSDSRGSALSSGQIPSSGVSHCRCPKYPEYLESGRLI